MYFDHKKIVIELFNLMSLFKEWLY